MLGVTYLPPINVSKTEPAPPNTNAAPPIAPSSSTTTTAPPLSRPTTPKQRLTLSSFPFPTSTASNPGTRAMVVNNDDRAVMNHYRDWIQNDCIQRRQPLNVLYTSWMDTESYELARSVTNKWNRQCGDKTTLPEDFIEALIHRISLGNVRNTPTKAKRRKAKIDRLREPPHKAKEKQKRETVTLRTSTPPLHSLGRELPDKSESAGICPLSSPSTFPSFPELLLLALPSAAVAEEMLPCLGYRPSAPPALLVLSVPEWF
ncbi:hypothetical protein BDD12DRAFT_890649 [Trichophaea hybrida]|nr:hypothetical protein BDD12DRAFT_890649 [Trichophaea hybrida]